MTTTPIRPPRRDWRRGLAGLGALLADPHDTQAIFEILHALDGPASYRGYLRLLGSLEGGRQAYRRAELAVRLADAGWLDAFAPGSYGAAYRDFVRARGFSDQALMERAALAARGWDFAAEHPVFWYARRITDLHDLWHVLTGYGSDLEGESCLVAFSYGQTRSLGFALIELGALFALPGPHPWRARAAILEAFRLGFVTRPLLAHDYEALMALPLAEARQVVELPAPRLYRPGT